MTPSDEAVQRGIRGVLDATGNALTEDEARFYSETVLDAACPSGEQPGQQARGAKTALRVCADLVEVAHRDGAGLEIHEDDPIIEDAARALIEAREDLQSSGEYQRAVSDVVAFLKNNATKCMTKEAEHFNRTLGELIERRFAPTSEGEE